MSVLVLVLILVLVLVILAGGIVVIDFIVFDMCESMFVGPTCYTASQNQ